MKYYHGTKQKGQYFEGWYFKHRKNNDFLALIPAVHIDKSGHKSASLQIITDNDSHWIEYPDSEFTAFENCFRVQVGNSVFSSEGARLNVESGDISLHGEVRYGAFTPLRYDIMGPFRFFDMQCSHGVLSLNHTLSGTLTLSGRKLDFSDGVGYIETDRGRSFPNSYLWTQCVWDANSIMLSVAEIPTFAGKFTGCICSVLYGGREWRLATYLGACIKSLSKTGVEIQQGKYRFTVEIERQKGQPLRAPVMGNMERVIRENLSTVATYRFWRGEELIFEHSDLSSFEYSAK